MIELGIVKSDVGLSARDEQAPSWAEVPNQAWEEERMAVYAAMVTAMDRGIGRVWEHIKQAGQADDTLVVFLSDNGGCAEFLREDGWHQRYALPTRAGGVTRVGDRPDLMPGPEDTFMSYGLPWANASNTPFRKFKAWTHEGGISTPFIVSWPSGGVAPGALLHEPAHLVDLAPTVLAAANVPPLASVRGMEAPRLEGSDLLPWWRGAEGGAERSLYWDHEGHSAVRRGQWKVVRAAETAAWELYRMDTDRIEQRDLSAEYPEVVGALAADYARWAQRVGVLARSEVK